MVKKSAGRPPLSEHEKKSRRLVKLYNDILEIRPRVLAESEVDRKKAVGRPGVPAHVKLERMQVEFWELAQELNDSSDFPPPDLLAEPDHDQKPTAKRAPGKSVGRPPATRIEALEKGIRRNLARIERIQSGEEDAKSTDDAAPGGRPRMSNAEKIANIEARISADRLEIKQEEAWLSQSEKLELDIRRLQHTARGVRKTVKEKKLLAQLAHVASNYSEAVDDPTTDKDVLDLASLERRIAEKQAVLKSMREPADS